MWLEVTVLDSAALRHQISARTGGPWLSRASFLPHTTPAQSRRRSQCKGVTGAPGVEVTTLRTAAARKWTLTSSSSSEPLSSLSDLGATSYLEKILVF